MNRTNHYRRRCLAAALVAAIAVFLNGVTITHAAEPDPPANRFSAAIEHFQNARWDEAIDEFRQAIDAEEDRALAASARLYLAEALLLANRAAEAAAEYRSCLKGELPAEARATAEFRLAEALYIAGDYEPAARAAADFCDNHPTHSAAPRALLYHAEAAYSAKNWTEAETAAARFTAIFPDDAAAERATLLQAACLLQVGRARAAWTALVPHLDDEARRRYPAIDSLAGFALSALAEEAATAGRPDEAASLCDRLLQEFPKHERTPHAAFRRAQLAADAGDWTAAASRFTAAIDRGDLGDELTPAAWLGRVQALAQDRRWDEVVETAADARRKFPAWPQTFEFDYLRGRAHIGRAELVEAREAFALVLSTKAATGSETAALARFMTAETHFLQRNYSAALTDYEQAASCDFPHWREAASAQCSKCREQLQRK